MLHRITESELFSLDLGVYCFLRGAQYPGVVHGKKIKSDLDKWAHFCYIIVFPQCTVARVANIFKYFFKTDNFLFQKVYYSC